MTGSSKTYPFLKTGRLKKPGSQQKPWKIIIADDEEEVHGVTKFALEEFSFENREILFLSAYSGEETKKLIKENPDTAVILLDIVMEKENTGLEVVEYIRRELKNPYVRIILRTGQPGQAPQREVIKDFDINDYKEKVELTDQKLFTTLVASLRAFRDLKALESALIDKEILLQEIHHRVKNNLQVISSLLSMQALTIKDSIYLEAFKESRDRIRSMALIHEKLYKSKSFNEINFCDYLNTMTLELFSLYGTDKRIERKIHCEKISLSLEKAIPCGLIVNELVTNSLKHAFVKDEKGEILIRLKNLPNDFLELTIQDTGTGLPRTLDPKKTQTLGLQLVSILADQIGAKISIKSSAGTEFTLSFKIR